jgi:hypothetical protein
MKFYFNWLVVLFIFAGCATKPVKETHSAWLFPMGVYEQRITLTPNNPLKNSQAFRGMLSISKENIQVVGLSPFGNTVFQIQEDRASKKVTTNIYVENLKRFEGRIQDYYSVLRNVLLAPRAGEANGVKVLKRDDKGRPTEFAVPLSGATKNLLISRYDGSGVPEELKFDSEDHKISVLVKSYELSN